MSLKMFPRGSNLRIVMSAIEPYINYDFKMKQATGVFAPMSRTVMSWLTDRGINSTIVLLEGGSFGEFKNGSYTAKLGMLQKNVSLPLLGCRRYD